MKYISYTFIDAASQIPVSIEPAKSGPIFPDGVEHVFSIETSFQSAVPIFYGTSEDSYEVPSWMLVYAEDKFIEEFIHELKKRASEKRKRILSSLCMKHGDTLYTHNDFIGLKDTLSCMLLDKSVTQVNFLSQYGEWTILALSDVKVLVKKMNKSVQNTYTSFYNFDKEIDSCSTIEDCLSIQSKLNNFNME